jgi:hypothetical protein
MHRAAEDALIEVCLIHRETEGQSKDAYALDNGKKIFVV